jgi:hypothetical protein
MSTLVLVALCCLCKSPALGSGRFVNWTTVLQISDLSADRRVAILYLTNQSRGDAALNIQVATGVFYTIIIHQTRTSVACSCT